MSLKELKNTIRLDQETNPIQKDHCSCKMPSNKEVKQIVQLTKMLIFPGYFTHSQGEVNGSRGQTNRLISLLYRKLKRQIAYTLLYITDGSNVREKSHQASVLAELYLEAIPKLRAILKTDLEAHYTGDPAAYNHDQIIVSYPGFYAI